MKKTDEVFFIVRQWRARDFYVSYFRNRKFSFSIRGFSGYPAWRRIKDFDIQIGKLLIQLSTLPF